MIKISGLKDFNLEHIFDCGQCFRWNKQEDGSYVGIAMGKVVDMRYEDGALTIENAEEADFERIWKPYLDLDTDYGVIKKTLVEADESGVMAQAIKAGEGIRILRQELWETMVSFIISQNNNIPRIKGCIENLSQILGTYAGEFKGKDYYNIPTPEVLAKSTERDLLPVKLGYRSRYLIETARAVVSEGGLIKKDLAKYTGVGPKVASCIELFGRHNLAAFPIDVWVKRVMHKLYGFEEKDVKGMADFAVNKFGELGGVAQQYLFYYIRENDVDLTL